MPLLGAIYMHDIIMAIKSPLQAFNAVEFCMQLKESGQKPGLSAVVFCPPRKPALAYLIKSILGRCDCNRIHVVPNLPSGKQWWCSPKEFLSAQRFRRAVSAALATVPAGACLLMGDYRSRECRHLAACAGPSEIILLDDGSATHQIARHRNNPSDPALAPMFPGDDVRTFRLRLLANIRLPSPRSVRFFSHYPIGALARDTLQAHRYEFWRGVIAQRSRTTRDEVLFLGMSHVEKRLTSLGRYVDTLREILACYGGRKILYRPHRDEAGPKLEAVRALGFEVLPFDLTPIELVLIDSDTLPAEVGCIASSAIDNLSILFGDTLTIRCFVPAADYCANAMSGHFQDIIRHHAAGASGRVQVTPLANA